MPQKPEEDPSTESSAFMRMAPRWSMINALLGGTEAMRDAGEEFLPRHERERDNAYSERLEKATLANFFELTLDLLSGKPFAEPIQLSDDMDARLKEYAEDIDLQGNDLDRFSYQVFRTALAKTFTHVLVDAPAADDTVRTLADERERGVRPYWVHIEPENLFFAEAIRIDGVEVLTHIRFREYEVRRQGFAEVEEEYIRVLELREIPTEREGEFQVRMISQRYKKDTTKKAQEQWIAEEAIITDLDRIPLVTFYTSRDGLMMGKPPLLDLAYMNVEHWQSYSDQMNILTVARFPILAASGVDEEEVEQVVVGPRNLLSTLDPMGKYYYVEHAGAAIEAGRDSLEDLEKRMALYGASLLAKRPDRETASARTASEESVTTPLRRMINAYSDVLNKLFQFTAEIVNIDAAGTVKIFSDFEADTTDAVELQTLQVAYKEGAISRITLINELKRRGIISDELDPENEETLLKAELALREAIAKAARGGDQPAADGGGDKKDDKEDENGDRGDVRRPAARGKGGGGAGGT